MSALKSDESFLEPDASALKSDVSALKSEGSLLESDLSLESGQSQPELSTPPALSVLFDGRHVQRVPVPQISFYYKKQQTTAPVYIRNTGREGLGVFAASDIPENTPVTFYFGSLVESDKQSNNNAGGGSHMLGLSNHGAAFVPGTGKTHINGCIQPGFALEDYVARGAVGSFLNASTGSQANCKLEVSRCDQIGVNYILFDPFHTLQPGERFIYVILKTKTAVKAGTQLRWDYHCDSAGKGEFMDIDPDFSA